jgi:DNA-binding NarL/FixJ family response regulator
LAQSGDCQVRGKTSRPKILKKNSGASIQRRQYVALSEHADVFSAQRVFRSCARAYLSIEDAPELLRAFDEISTGRPYVGASVLPLILSNFAAGPRNSCSSDINSLSDRELEIFSFIARGVSVSELATELHVSVKTFSVAAIRASPHQ